MTPVIAHYIFEMFLTFNILQVRLPNVVWPGLTYPPVFSLSLGLGALITR